MTLPTPPTARRDQILARVSAALRGRARTPHPGPLQTLAPSVAEGRDEDLTTSAGLGGLAAAFATQFAANGGESMAPDRHRPRREWLGDAILALEDGPDASPAPPSVAFAKDVPAELRPELPAALPAEADVGIVLAWGAVAETGTLLLTPDGGRAVQLLPPTLVAWVPGGRMFAGLGDALAELRDSLPAVVGLHSGPSKSADIGRTVVTGVHGPGRCIAVLDDQ